MIKSSGRVAFCLMTVLFRVRDAIRPPEAALCQIGVALGQTVLDYGCGPGSFSLAAAKLVGPTGRIYAVDINPWAVSRVQRLSERGRFTNIVAKVGKNPSVVPVHSIDLAILHDVLHELEDPDLVISSLWCTLKPEGVLAVNDHHMKADQIVSRITSGGPFDLARSVNGTQCFNARTRK